MDNNAGKVYIYENIISEKLDMEYDKIWKIAYMNEDSKKVKILLKKCRIIWYNV